MDYTIGGTLEILPMGIYVNDNNMANILSLKEMADYFRVDMYNKKDHTMLVYYNKDKANRFKECRKGLYYLDVSNPEIIPLTTESGNTDYSLLSTVNVNMEFFTCEDIEGADREHDLKNILGLIINFPVLSDDMRRAHASYWPATAILKGKW